MQKPREPRLDPPKKHTIIAKLWWVVAIICVLATVFFAYLWDRQDFITFSPSPTPGEKAVLIDGVKDGVFQNDWNPGVVSPATNSVEIGYFTMPPSPNSGEVVAFSPGKAPFIKASSPWSIFTDTINVDFHDAYNIKVKIWLLTDKAFNRKWRIQHLDCPTALSIWQNEGHGLQITCDIQDARNTMLMHADRSGQAMTLFDDSAPGHLAFDCDDLDNSDLLSSASYSTGVLNVYYVDQVSTVIGSGERYAVHCNGTPTVIAIGAASVEGLLAHEVGHALIGNGDEDHIDNLSPGTKCPSPTPCAAPPPYTTGNTPSFFDRTNVMHGASSRRATLTEGQVFRAFFNVSSVLNHNSIYNLGMGIRTTCGGVGSGSSSPSDSAHECPQLEKRLWPDYGGEYGTWPAN